MDPAKLFDNGGGGNGGGGGYPAANFSPSQTGQLTAYQPNYSMFYNPLAMLQAGQPSFQDPAWYTSMLGPAQQQNMMASAPVPAATAPQMPENPWLPGGEYAKTWDVIGPVAGRMPSQRSRIQHLFTGQHLSPAAMRLMAG